MLNTADRSQQMTTNRILSFDFGLKRIGVATGNQQTKTAQALSTLPASNGQPHWHALDDILQQWKPGIAGGWITTGNGWQ